MELDIMTQELAVFIYNTYIGYLGDASTECVSFAEYLAEKILEVYNISRRENG